MFRAAIVLAVTVLVVMSFPMGAVQAQDVFKESFFELQLPPGWSSTKSLPSGIKSGFRKSLGGGKYATFFIAYEIMPPEVGEPPKDTSNMQRQYATLITRQFPGAKAFQPPAFKISGPVMINQGYELTDGGVKLKRLYTSFFLKPGNFAVQCSAPPDEWGSAVKDFEVMLVSLKPRSDAKKEKVSDQAAIQDAKRTLSTQSGSLPSQWTFTVKNVAIVSPPADKKVRVLQLDLAFHRSDISGIYDSCKAAFGKMADGTVTAESQLKDLPFLSQVPDFIKYVGQSCGLAYSCVLHCDPPIDRFLVVLSDASGKKAGSVSISSKDLVDIIGGKVGVAEMKRVSQMYRFE